MIGYCKGANSAALRTGVLVQKGSQCKKQKLQLKRKGMFWSAKLLHVRFVRESNEQIQLIEWIEFISEFDRVYSHVSLKGICKCIQQSKKLLAFSIIFQICPATFGKQWNPNKGLSSHIMSIYICIWPGCHKNQVMVLIRYVPEHLEWSAFYHYIFHF